MAQSGPTKNTTTTVKKKRERSNAAFKVADKNYAARWLARHEWDKHRKWRLDQVVGWLLLLLALLVCNEQAIEEEQQQQQ